MSKRNRNQSDSDAYEDGQHKDTRSVRSRFNSSDQPNDRGRMNDKSASSSKRYRTYPLETMEHLIHYKKNTRISEKIQLPYSFRFEKILVEEKFFSSLDMISIAKQSCRSCQTVNLARIKFGLSQIHCILSSNFKQCALCICSKKHENECCANNINGDVGKPVDGGKDSTSNDCNFGKNNFNKDKEEHAEQCAAIEAQQSNLPSSEHGNTLGDESSFEEGQLERSSEIQPSITPESHLSNSSDRILNGGDIIIKRSTSMEEMSSCTSTYEEGKFEKKESTCVNKNTFKSDMIDSKLWRNYDLHDDSEDVKFFVSKKVDNDDKDKNDFDYPSNGDQLEDSKDKLIKCKPSYDQLEKELEKERDGFKREREELQIKYKLDREIQYKEFEKASEFQKANHKGFKIATAQVKEQKIIIDDQKKVINKQKIINDDQKKFNDELMLDLKQKDINHSDELIKKDSRIRELEEESKEKDQVNESLKDIIAQMLKSGEDGLKSLNKK